LPPASNLPASDLMKIAGEKKPGKSWLTRIYEIERLALEQELPLSGS
jgi:hypothetical protein